MTAMRFDLPQPDLETQPFWDAARDGKLLIKHCNACDEFHFYPRPFCPKCWSDDVAWAEARGGRTFTRGPSCTATTCRRSVNACPTSPQSSTWPRVRA